MTEPSTADYQAELTAEYGQFVAIAPIDYYGTRAYNIGHPVPASNVQRYGYEAAGLVKRVDNAAAPAATPASLDDIHAPVDLTHEEN